jgi:hypothetical protein
MSKKLTSTKSGTKKQQGVPVKNEGLVTQIVQEFLKKLRESTLVEADVVKSLEDLASKGNLKDLEAVQAALRTPPRTNDNATS